MRQRDWWIPYLLIAPSVVFLLIFFVWPLLEAIGLAFVGPSGFGFEHFRRMAGDLYFKDAFKNTLLLVLVIVPLQLILALALSMLIGGLNRGRDLYLYIWTIPLGISDLAAGIAWLAIFTERGYFNSLLGALGLVENPPILLGYQTPLTLFLAVVMAELWRATAVVMVILISGLQLIPKMYAEAAEVFGATPWQRFWRVTLPLLRPSLQTALILRTIAAFEVFAVVNALGGRNLPVLAGESYNWYATNQNPNVAAAYAVLVLVISLVATLLYLRLIPVRQEAQV
jgi:multiple sugar transport system permease protein